MTREERVEFIDSMVAAYKQTLIDQVDKVPERWGQVEMRMWVAARFSRMQRGTGQNEMPIGDYRQYLKDIVNLDIC